MGLRGPTRAHLRGALGFAATLAWLTTTVNAESAGEITALSRYGTAGHVDMPSAYALPDGYLSLSFSGHGGGVVQGNMVFQITPRLSGTFRYSYWDAFFGPGLESLYDRSFDIKYILAHEDRDGWWPALAVGLQDFSGTGGLSAEYLVASKHFGPDLHASLGIGWGRFGSYGGFRNPLSHLSARFDTRPGLGTLADTGRISTDRFFRGETAAFFAADWRVSPRLSLSFEYSSDAMVVESQRMGFAHRSPINLGLRYQTAHGGVISAAALYGSVVALGYSYSFDPARAPAPSGYDPAPPSVGKGRAAREVDLPRIKAALRAQGAPLHALAIDGDTAVVTMENTRWYQPAQFWGRSSRVLSAELPQELRHIRLRTSVQSMAITDVTLARADLEELEHAPDGAWQIYARADLAEGPARLAVPTPPERRFGAQIRPYAEPGYFDPDNPLRLDVGAQFRADWTPLSGLYFSGAVRQKILGNQDEVSRRSDSVLPHVRSDGPLYAQTDGPQITWATAEYFFRPAPELYARGTVGLFERMFGGVSAELLWVPQGERFTLGAEINYAIQRDFDGWGFLDYRVWTGHVSGSYDLGEGYRAELDVGRYLAGDTGATITLARRFGNGFELGAFATFTNVSADDFGEGAFDKGIMISLPTAWLLGQPTRERIAATIRPLQRDGGARLSVRNRLHARLFNEIAASRGTGWGRFWR